MCALFHYGKIQTELWPLCRLSGCRSKKIKDANALTCTRIASLHAWLASFLPMAPALKCYMQKDNFERASEEKIVLRVCKR
jgi:hypothetical protein